MPAPQTVLIVEDDEAISDSIAYALERAGFRTLRAGDGGQGLRLFRQQRPDLVILDLMLPQVDGWRVTEEVRREDPRVPVIVCSARTSEFDRVHGLEMGADDYVTKPFSMKELLARVQAHLRRVESHRGQPGGESIEVAGLLIDPEQVQAFVDGRPVGFTPREFEVLYALAHAEGKPVPRERVYREVWGYEMMPRRPVGRRLRAKGAPEAHRGAPGHDLRPDPLRGRLPLRARRRGPLGRGGVGPHGGRAGTRSAGASLPRARDPGGMPERPKGAVCKTAGYAYGGSNPPPPIIGLSACDAGSRRERPEGRFAVWTRPGRLEISCAAAARSDKNARPPSARPREPQIKRP